MIRAVGMILLLGFYSLGWSVRTYQTSLKMEFPADFRKIDTLLSIKAEDKQVMIREYSSVEEFTSETAAAYWIRGFTNAAGIFLQSRYLLGEVTFSNVLEHELLHWTLRQNATFPSWFEEGVVCVITNELADYEGFSTPALARLPVMANVEEVAMNTLQNPWEMISFSLGCVKKVREILNLSGGAR